MPTQLEFIKAKVSAYKATLTPKTHKEKEGRISIQMAQQVNAFVEEIKKEAHEAATHLPQPIGWDSPFARVAQAEVSFLELEMMLNQILAVLDVLREDH